MKWAGMLVLAGLSVACAGGAVEAPASSSEAETAAAAAQPETPAPAAASARTPARTAPPAAAAAAPAARDITVPAGTELQLELVTPLASNTSVVEDEVRATLRAPLTVRGETVLPAGAELIGHVTGVERSGRVKGRARLDYQFTRVQHGSSRYTVETAPVSHEAEATKSEDATKIGIGAGAGAIIGGILGGGDGAAKGAAIGGAAGTGAVLATRGKEVELAAGAPVTTSLTAPLRIRVKG